MVTASSWSWVMKRKVVRISRCSVLQEPLHLVAEFRIERAERLIEENQARLADDRARERHALLLAAGELRRIAVAEIAERDQRQRLLHPLADISPS